MVKILVTGAESYIGESFKTYILQQDAKYQVDTLDLMDKSWKEYDFSGYKVIFHVAGIAHQKESKKNAPIYYEVNRDLAYDVAKTAKEKGVKQFIYLSSMSVYGKDTGIIDLNTKPMPTTNYGKSKLEGEDKINSLRTDGFKVAILRPPMVYGKDCKGNFQSLVKIAKKTFIFPHISNERSMIYIFNLCEFVRLIIENESDGLFLPQNKEYVKTEDIMRILSCKLKKKIYFSVLLGAGVKVMMLLSKKCKKAFGSLVYHQEDDLGYSYCKTDFESSIKESL